MRKGSSEDCHASSGETTAIITNNNTNEVSVTADTGITIHLTQEEEELFDTLRHTAQAYQSGRIHLPSNLFTSHNNIDTLPQAHRIEIRIAGGWVRDKILKQDSHDIDVALNCMSGHAFATLVQSYLQTLQSDDANMVPSSTHKIAVISANPEQSKHLETATMKIHGMDIDFVNLRSEEMYQADSRIPTITQPFGTPTEDAFRRDFTINSLFYNIQTGKIEDWTGRGIQDLLYHPQLVTPLNAHITFLDDPLRLLRAIRFSVRYHLPLHPEIVEAARSTPVHEALHLKVSRERVGKELEGMLVGKGAQPSVALDLLTQLKLAGSVFCFPPEEDHSKNDNGGHLQVLGNLMGYNYTTLSREGGKSRVRELAWLESTQLIHIVPHVFCNFQSQMTHRDLSSTDPPSTVDERLLYLSTFLLPLRHLTYLDKKKKEASLVSYIVRESIKFKNKDITDVVIVLDHVPAMQSLVERFEEFTRIVPPSPSLSSELRLEIGLLLRRVKDLWVTLLLIANVLLIRQCDQQIDSEDRRSRSLQLCLKLYYAIVDFGLDRCWTVRPLIDGRELIHILGISAGPKVAKFLDEQTKWMLLHPQGSRNDCEAFLKQKQSVGDEETEGILMINGVGKGP